MENSCLNKGLIKVPYHLKRLDKLDDFPTDTICYSTVASFKGLESDAIIVADIDDLREYEARQLLYVGCSRAVAYLAVFLNENLRGELNDLATIYGIRLKPKQETELSGAGGILRAILDFQSDER